MTGPLIYGGLGAIADHLLGTSWLVGAGIVGGMALSLYLICSDTVPIEPAREPDRIRADPRRTAR